MAASGSAAWGTTGRAGEGTELFTCVEGGAAGGFTGLADKLVKGGGEGAGPDGGCLSAGGDKGPLKVFSSLFTRAGPDLIVCAALLCRSWGLEVG